MNRDFVRHHKTALITFVVGLGLAIVFFTIPDLHALLRQVDRLGYPGMLLAGIMYGGALTSAIAAIIFIDAPQHLHPIVVGLLGGLGAAVYDLTVFYITRHETDHGWLSNAIIRLRERWHIPNWTTLSIGMLILASPLPDELAAGLFGINHGKAMPFFFISFASNALGIFILSGAL